MKSLVVYHSTSGNTKKIAYAVHAGMSQSGEQCDIARIKDVSTEDLAEYDLIGLGSPVMRLRELHNVSDFIENTMKNVDGKHGFAFCTHGAMPGHYLSRVVPAMMQRGVIIIGWNDWFGDAFHPGCPKPYFTDGHPDEIDLKEAEEFGREMVERSKRIYQGETELIPEFPRGKDYDELYNPAPQPPKDVYVEFCKARDRMEFNVNQEKCNYPKCTLCIDNCPVSCMDFSVSPPLIDVNCERCYLCIQICPTTAIEVDWQPFHETHVPMVPALQDSLEIFEARGKFRRLVPMDEIGWDTYVWQLKHPLHKPV